MFLILAVGIEGVIYMRKIDFPSRPLTPFISALRPWLGLALVCAGFSLHPKFLHTFWTREYLPNVLQQSATNIILAVGMTFVILTGGIDLSVGSVMALCGVALGMTVKTGPPPFLACAMALPGGVLMAVLTSRVLSQRRAVGQVASGAVALLVTLIGGMVVWQATEGGIRLEGALIATLMVGAACGLLNGLFITIGRVPPFVVTLGMMTATRGLTVYATDGNSVSGLPPRLGALGVGVPLMAMTLAVVALSAALLLRTSAGRYILSIGGNEEAARLSGVNVTVYKTLAYLLSGIASAIAAIVLTAKFQLADTGAGMGAELNAIAAVVIGGTSLSGGRGSVIGTLIGALTIQVLNAGLVIIGVKDTLQLVIIGAVIVVTVMMDQYWKVK